MKDKYCSYCKRERVHMNTVLLKLFGGTAKVDMCIVCQVTYHYQIAKVY